MNRTALPLLLLLAGAPTAYGFTGAQGQAERIESMTDAAARAGNAGEARALGDGAWRDDGSVSDGGGSAVSAGGRGTGNRGNFTASSPAPRQPRAEPPPPGATEPLHKRLLDRLPPKSLSYGAGAVLGGLQGFLNGGLLAGLGGAALGLAGAHLFTEGNYVGAFGITAGSIIGSAIGGPLGGLVGGIIGGVLGTLLGKLF